MKHILINIKYSQINDKGPRMTNVGLSLVDFNKSAET